MNHLLPISHNNYEGDFMPNKQPVKNIVQGDKQCMANSTEATQFNAHVAE